MLSFLFPFLRKSFYINLRSRIYTTLTKFIYITLRSRIYTNLTKFIYITLISRIYATLTKFTYITLRSQIYTTLTKSFFRPLLEYSLVDFSLEVYHCKSNMYSLFLPLTYKFHNTNHFTHTTVYTSSVRLF